MGAFLMTQCHSAPAGIQFRGRLQGVREQGKMIPRTLLLISFAFFASLRDQVFLSCALASASFPHFLFASLRLCVIVLSVDRIARYYETYG